MRRSCSGHRTQCRPPTSCKTAQMCQAPKRPPAHESSEVKASVLHSQTNIQDRRSAKYSMMNQMPIAKTDDEHVFNISMMVIHTLRRPAHGPGGCPRGRPAPAARRGGRSRRPRRRPVLRRTQSRTSQGIGRQGLGSFCKQSPCFSTMPCRQMPFLVHF